MDLVWRSTRMKRTKEHKRLEEHKKRLANWRHWGPYLSERAWATVREDYSIDGNAWDYFPHEHARSRVYRWNEDGLAGICDRNQFICFALSLWNGQDPILKERLFGLIPRESNHGEDVKECYFYVDNVPTHSYMKMLYKYPQQAFPYQHLVEVNEERTTLEPEYELTDTGIFDESRYFDVFIEYAKADQEDILIKFTVWNRSSEAAPCYVLPTVWFRNTWSWGYPHGPMGDVEEKPVLYASKGPKNTSLIQLDHSTAGTYYLYADQSPTLLFTENETNTEKLFQQPNASPYVKDAFHRYIVEEELAAVNPEQQGTKAAASFYSMVEPGQPFTVRLRLTKDKRKRPFFGFDSLVTKKALEADAFYQSIHAPGLSIDDKLIQRQAYAGLLWSKQFFYYDVQQWLEGDSQSLMKLVPRHLGRNKDWIHLVNFDVISMPDKWEYPWYASWDLGFHCISLVMIDPDFAKRQLILMTREWYMHPNGQIPAYEWNFSDVNPPVLAWAAWRVYKIEGKQSGTLDKAFLESIFHKLLLNFTWWVNQKDALGHNVFQGGFLGLDNISIFDRSVPLKEGRIDQADGTAWMGFYCILMMKISLELARYDSIYQDTATKFFEHFLRITNAMIAPERKGYSLWDEEDGFFYDVLHLPNGENISLKIRSIVGLLPLFAVETIEPQTRQDLPIYNQRVEWFLNQRADYATSVACVETAGKGRRQLLSVLTKERLVSTLRYMLDEDEFLSPYGIRSLSKHHEKNPYFFNFENQELSISYEPGDSTYRLWGGGNSNWRGPIWFPINFLIIESLQKYFYYYGEDLKVEFPTGSGHYLNLWDVAEELSKRLISLFSENEEGFRPIYGNHTLFNKDPNWQRLILFHEFFHGDEGLGLGASHQTGWTSLIAKLLQQSGS